MLIREAGDQDCASVHHLIEVLEAQSFRPTQFAMQFRLNLLDPRSTYMVADADGEVVGFGSLSIHWPLHHEGPVAEIVELVVSEAWRGRGVGQLLLERLLAVAREWGCRCIDIDSNRSRERAHKFYMRHGFKLTHFKLTMCI